MALLCGIALLPVTYALPTTTPFPDLPFADFSQLILGQFGSQIKLTTVLMILFSLTQNSNMLNLHARQQHPQCDGEIRVTVTGWMKAFVWSLQNRLGATTDDLFQPSDGSLPSRDARITTIGRKVDNIVQGLGLMPYHRNGQFRMWLGQISDTDIAPIRLLCPNIAECMTEDCEPRALRQTTREHNIPRVILCEGTQVYHDVALTTGFCPSCEVGFLFFDLFYFLFLQN